MQRHTFCPAVFVQQVYGMLAGSICSCHAVDGQSKFCHWHDWEPLVCQRNQVDIPLAYNGVSLAVGLSVYIEMCFMINDDYAHDHDFEKVSTNTRNVEGGSCLFYFPVYCVSSHML